jgi:hypothetical protein
MVTMLEKCTTKKQHSIVRFWWAKGLNIKHILKYLFTNMGVKLGL